MDAEQADELFRLMHSMAALDPARKRIRSELVVGHLTLAHRLARRCEAVIEPLEDLQQVAVIGLIKAVDNFNPDMGVPFPGYAVPKITGELSRFLRDLSGVVRVPRPVQELQSELRSAIDQLSAEEGRLPTTVELASYLHVEASRIEQALQADWLRFPRSLEQPMTTAGRPLNEVVGHADAGIEQVEQRASLNSMLADLPERERRILLLSALHGLNQRQVAKIVGVSQMHVSRLLSRALKSMRCKILAGALSAGWYDSGWCGRNEVHRA